VSLDADALAEMARNRGLKLVRSRVRTPGKPGYGTFGLTDSGGEPVFGMKGKALIASAEAVANYLRGAEASDWKASLKAAGGHARRRRKVSSASPEPEAAPVPVPELREARAEDALAVAALIAPLGFELDAATVAANLAALGKQGDPILVIAEGERLVGLCGVARTVTVHRRQPVGRITLLVVAEEARGRGFGRQLVVEAERRLTALGCSLMEVTSNDRLTEAHAFYRHLGYERTSMRFAKPLPAG
jgi:ribosomal protein S18 acetylase RimI-like enzyme